MISGPMPQASPIVSNSGLASMRRLFHAARQPRTHQDRRARSSRRGNLAQRALEDLDRLPALDQMAIVDDHCRHRVDALRLVEVLALAHFARMLGTGGEHLLRPRSIEPDFGGRAQQHVVRAGFSPSVK